MPKPRRKPRRSRGRKKPLILAAATEIMRGMSELGGAIHPLSGPLALQLTPDGSGPKPARRRKTTRKGLPRKSMARRRSTSK